MNREVDFISSSMSMISLSLAPVERLKNARRPRRVLFFSYRCSKHEESEFANSIDFLIDQGFISVHQWVERGVDTLRRAWSFETGWFEAFFIEKQLQTFASFRNQVCLWKKPLVFQHKCEIHMTCHPHSIRAICCRLMDYSIGIRSARHVLWAKERVDSDLYSWCYNDNLI